MLLSHKQRSDRFLLVLLVMLLANFANSQVAKKKVVFVIADGIPADIIERVAKPHMDLIIQAGAYKRAYVGGIKGTYNQTPTISAPGYNNLLTGVWADKHNVFNNDIKAPNYHYWSIFRYLKNQQPSLKTAVFSSWIDNRTKLVGEGLPETGGYKVDYAFDGYELDTLRFPHDKKGEYLHQIDLQVVHKADSVIRKSAPDLSWIYLEYTDEVGHIYGNGAIMDQAVNYLDEQMGSIYSAIEYRKKNFGEDWLLVITTDHGRDAKNGMNHGGQSDRERTTWLVTNYPKLNEYFKQFNPAIVDILPSITSFMQLEMPKENQEELDGVSMIGKVSLANARASVKNDSLWVSWNSFEKESKLKISITYTDAFKKGAVDVYTYVTTVPIADNAVVIPINKLLSGKAKILLEAKHNKVNTVVSLPEKNNR
ncbi:MAG: alkaline phosphatase family protein [Bacteroidota bacterium]